MHQQHARAHDDHHNEQHEHVLLHDVAWALPYVEMAAGPAPRPLIPGRRLTLAQHDALVHRRSSALNEHGALVHRLECVAARLGLPEHVMHEQPYRAVSHWLPRNEARDWFLAHANHTPAERQAVAAYFNWQDRVEAGDTLPKPRQPRLLYH